MQQSHVQRVSFCKTVSLFNHILQPSQACALFYQTLTFSLKNFNLIKWISTHIDIPTALQLFMIDINGHVTCNEILYSQLTSKVSTCQTSKEGDIRSDLNCILKWISKVILRLSTDYSLPSKNERSMESEAFYNFLKQFYIIADDRSTLSDNDEIIMNDQDDEDISKRAIQRALMKCADYLTKPSDEMDNIELNSNIRNFESNDIAIYNQQIIQILCSDTLELEVEIEAAKVSIKLSKYF